MPQPEQVTALAADAAARITAMWKRVEDAQEAVLAAVRAGRSAGLARLLRRLRAAAAETQAVTARVAEDLARRGIPLAYAAGASGSGLFIWDGTHLDAVTRLAQETYDDLLAASREVGRTSAAFARQVRAAVAARVPAGVQEGRTAVQIGRQIARDLEQAGVSAVTYRDGSRHGLSDYADMVARTKTAVAYNEGTLGQLGREQVQYVEVFDGTGCGIRSHTDPEKANGSIWTLELASSYPISHPRCQRSFGGRPDLVTAGQAAAAGPSTTAGQRADQAAAESARRAANERRAANRAAVRRRNARLARTGAAA